MEKIVIITLKNTEKISKKKTVKHISITVKAYLHLTNYPNTSARNC